MGKSRLRSSDQMLAWGSLLQLARCIAEGIRVCIVFVLGGFIALSASAQIYDPTHAALTEVLTAHVASGQVDYAAIKADPAKLVSYLDGLAGIPETTFQGWSKPDQIAFLINLYNATTIKLIIDNYPVASIKKLGSLFRGPWKQSVVRVFGETKTLDNIEHDILRPKYNEPRIHFALVCAAKSCPPLRSEAYVGDRLEQQFLDQGRVFLATPSKNDFDLSRKVMTISKIFDWFEKDFIAGSGSVEKFLLPYLDPKIAEAVGAGGFSIAYTAYDWSLNDK
jgi:Protein of unknown function, DUF547